MVIFLPQRAQREICYSGVCHCALELISWGAITPRKFSSKLSAKLRKQLDSANTLVVFATHSIVAVLRQLHLVSVHGGARIEFHPVSDTITMHEDPLLAIRHKRGSSIVVGIRLLKNNISMLLFLLVYWSSGCERHAAIAKVARHQAAGITGCYCRQ